MGTKSKNLLSLNKILTDKNVYLQQQVDELEIFKQMALKELAKLKSEIAGFNSSLNHLINGFFIQTITDKDGDKVLVITHEKRIFFFCDLPNQISIVSEE